MAKEDLMAKQIAEINQHIRDGISQWADVMKPKVNVFKKRNYDYDRI